VTLTSAQYFLFTVSDESWKEHFATGIAAINDPGHDPNNRQGNAQRQKAFCELAGIKNGDLLFFYLQQQKKIMGLYEATSRPFYDTRCLVTNGFINRKFPIRVAFNQKINFPSSLGMDEVWNSKDKGFFWSLQQQRGDSVGRHACISLTKQDGDHLLRMLHEKNPVIPDITKIGTKTHSKRGLPYDFLHEGKKLHYEAVLQSILLEDFKQGKHKEIFGEYDYFVPFFPTSSQKEIDILLFKHDNKGVLWYEILELKQHAFDQEELDKLMNYEDWVLNTLSDGNIRMVHSIGIANEFADDVKAYIKGRMGYGGRKIRLIKYSFHAERKVLSLTEETL